MVSPTPPSRRKSSARKKKIHPPVRVTTGGYFCCVDSEGRRDGMEDAFSMHGCGPSASRTLFTPRTNTEKDKDKDNKKQKKDRSSKGVDGNGNKSSDDEKEAGSGDAKSTLLTPQSDMESGQVAVFGVFDGHGGPTCADYCAQRLGSRVRTRLERITTMRTGGRPRPSPRGGRGGRGGRERGGGRGGGPANARRAPPAAPPSGKMMSRTVTKLFTDMDSEYLRESPDAKDGTTATVVVMQDQSTLTMQAQKDAQSSRRPRRGAGEEDEEEGQGDGSRREHGGDGFGLAGAEDGGLQIVIANVGDSSALLVTRDRDCVKVEEGMNDSTQLEWGGTEMAGDFAWVTTEHNASQAAERERVGEAGGLVLRAQEDGSAVSASLPVGGEKAEDDGSTYRVVNSQGYGLAVTRALGDFMFKPAVSAEPTCVSFRIPEESSEPAHSFLCIASDGLWGDVTPEEVAAVLLSIEPEAHGESQEEERASDISVEKSARLSTSSSRHASVEAASRRSNGSSSSTSRRVSRRSSTAKGTISARSMSRKQVSIQMVDKTVELTALALARGCQDNITIMVIDLYAARVALRGEMEATLKSVRQAVEGSGRGTSMRLSMGKPGSGVGRSRGRRQSTLSSASSLSNNITEGRAVSLSSQSSRQAHSLARQERRTSASRRRSLRRSSDVNEFNRAVRGESVGEMNGWGGAHHKLMLVLRSLLAILVALSVVLAMMSSRGRQLTRRAMEKMDDVKRISAGMVAAS